MIYTSANPVINHLNPSLMQLEMIEERKINRWIKMQMKKHRQTLMQASVIICVSHPVPSIIY